MVECGRLGPLPCWSGSASPAGTLALARTLARRGQLGLLIADDPGSERRTLAVSLPPVRATVVSHDAAALPLLRLSRVSATESLIGMAIAAASALDVDAAGRRAFRALRQAIARVTDHLDGRIRPEERHAWTLLQVTRLLFLRFVEAEGWLDGRPDFLRQALDTARARQRDPARHVLWPLFFGMLNRPVAERSPRVRAFGAVPFLNGGLFEPHPLEQRRKWHLPLDGWLQLFEPLVDGIEVTLEDGDPGDRVNPELLGRVFEGVMNPDERRAAGTFYTPPTLVDAVVREAYACHLTGKLGRPIDRIREGLDDPDPELQRALMRIRVLDPAVGSGAFLVGALHVAAGGRRTDGRRIRRLVTRNLFGVDRNPAAVRLTELRLWLEVLRSMRGRAVDRVAPLPNLDANIRAGDALLDPLAGLRLTGRIHHRLATARLAATTSHGADRRRALAELRAIECQAIDLALGRAEGRVETALRELIEAGRAPLLFGGASGIDREGRHRLADLRLARRTLRRERRRLRLDRAMPVFALESAFAVELARGGFDLVVGNPPWVRAERLPAAEREALRGRYRWWRSRAAGWRHLPDLSVAFLERALEVTASRGTIAMLVPSKLATTGYASTCRGALGHATTLQVVADLSDDPRAGFEATTYPMAIITSRAPAPPDHQVRCNLGSGSDSIPQQLWRLRGSWPLGPHVALAVAARLATRHPVLGLRFAPSLGVKTGANRVFLDPPPQLTAWSRPVIRGRDIGRHRTPPRRILWPADDRGEPLAALPDAVAAHLLPHRAELERRSDLSVGPWWRLFRTTTATARWRVAWADLARDLLAVVLEDPEPVPLNSCYVVAATSHEEARGLAAWLNSGPIRALARLEAEPAAGGFRRFGRRAIASVPMPPDALEDLAPQHPGDSIEDRQQRDERVAERLGLNAAERRALDAIFPPRR